MSGSDLNDADGAGNPGSGPGPGPRAHRWLKRRRKGGPGARRALWVGRVLIGLLSLMLVGLLGRVAQLQSDPPEPVAERVDQQQSRRELLARRGVMRDRQGRVLAASRVAHRLFVDPYLIEERSTFPARVAHELDYEPTDIARQLFGRSQDRYVVIDQRLTDERLEKAKELDLAGLATQPFVVRDYPHQKLAGPVIGIVGRDGRGLEGLELTFDEQLIGESGQYAMLRDGRRRPLWIQGQSYQTPRPGRDVRLSLDARLQRIAEKHLRQAVAEHNANWGQLVVMNPHTGEVVAMANVPDFNPNAFGQTTGQQRRNRAVTDTFEPGSIFKPFIWAGLTQAGAASPEEMIDCTEAGYWVTDFGRTLHDAHGMGTIRWDEVLIQSSNIGMAKAALRTDNETLHEMVARFGFGDPTGSELPGEVGGLVNPLPAWNEYSQTSVPMGQEIGSTGLQMVRGFAAFANEGLLLEPTIRPRRPAEREVVRRALPASLAKQTRQVLRRVVTEGTGRRARSALYRFFGKTGTAQLPNFEEGGYYSDRYLASFLGGGPTDRPRLVAGCFIHRPDPEVNHYGGLVSAPVVKTVLEESLQYLGVPPREDEAGEQRVAVSE